MNDLKMKKRRGSLGAILWTAAGGFLLAFIFLVLLAIIFRHPYRIDLTQEGEYSLSDATCTTLDLLNDEVLVIFPIFFQKDNPLHSMHARILWRARTLLDEYMARQPLIRLERQLDLSLPSDAEAWGRLRDKFELTTRHINRFLFISRDGSLRQEVSPDDLAVYDRPLTNQQVVQVHEFRAESVFTSTIARFIYREKVRIYSLEDHREANLQNPGPMGISTLKKRMEKYGYEVLPLSFSQEPKVPDDCDLLMIVAPDAPFGEEDRRRVNEYLRSGGRLLVALGQGETGLEELLDWWNIRVLTGRVYQHFSSGLRVGWIPHFIVSDFNVHHPITAQFQWGDFGILCSDARSLEFRDGNGLKGEFLLRTSREPSSFVDRNKNNQRDRGEEVGPKVVAGAIWRPMGTNRLQESKQEEVRIVALGDATMMINQRSEQYSHLDFLFNSVNWLLGHEEQITGSSSAWTERRLKWDQQIARFLFWVPVFLFPAIVLSLGSLIYFLRRS